MLMRATYALASSLDEGLEVKYSGTPSAVASLFYSELNLYIFDTLDQFFCSHGDGWSRERFPVESWYRGPA